MKYGFVIDNRKCIGCHACTVACKSEHDVPVGVNRTWVKQIEKGEYPNTRRIFSVLRCNHCADAPCVTICPTQALFTRDDGIVDFDNRRCIGCKSCMQACPYDALYIDPETNTAAKCNYCAHRVDIGLEPACVNVCPEHAIISGDMDDANSEIAQLISLEQVTVRKPEKGTIPNVFYIDGDVASLNPEVTERNEQYMWSQQAAGVGHYAKYAEDRLGTTDLVRMLEELNTKDRMSISPALDKEMGTSKPTSQHSTGRPMKSVEALMKTANTRRVYDAPDKGILWGWEVSGYVWTKAISAGAILVPFIAWLFGWDELNTMTMYISGGVSLVFLAATGLLLVMDLDQPMRFAYVLLRPQWNSWLVRGGYSITIFGAMVSLMLLGVFFAWHDVVYFAFWASAVSAVVVAVYTAFLFAQAKGRDFWQSPAMAPHMMVHSLMAGAAVFVLAGLATDVSDQWMSYLETVLMVTVIANMLIVTVELTITHPTTDAKRVVEMITKGRYSNVFWFGAILVGNIIPILLLVLTSNLIISAVGAVLILAGIYISEKIWVEAPQRIQLT
jgi:Fe-S-cluster-containing dehydrogenase component/formate-dependent nitrite reductase membrane component NrfD